MSSCKDTFVINKIVIFDKEKIAYYYDIILRKKER